MKKELIDFLRTLGFSASQIAAISAEIEKDTPDVTVLDSLKAEVKTTLTGLIMADPENNKSIHASAYGRARNECEAYVKKKFGLTPEEMKDKKFEEVVDTAHDKITENVTKDKKALLEETVSLTNKIKQLEEEEIPKVKSEVENKIKTIEMENLLVSELANTEKRKIIGKPKAILPSVLAQLGSMGVMIKEKEGGGFELVNKETNLQVKSKDGTRLLSNDEVLDWALDEVGLKENSTPMDDKKPIIINKEIEDNKNVNSNLGLSEAEAQLKVLQQQQIKK